MSVTFYYHGGVPNKKPGDHILPAAALGLNYTWAYRNIPGVRLPDESQTKYRPDFAYFTTHLGSARGYAARYADAHRRPIPGDVYQVDLTEITVEPDPDFNGPETAAIYIPARQPVTILAAVERRVILNRREQNEVCWPYLYYADHDEVVHDYDGTVRASREMRSYGVTDDYLAPVCYVSSDRGSASRSGDLTENSTGSRGLTLDVSRSREAGALTLDGSGTEGMGT